MATAEYEAKVDEAIATAKKAGSTVIPLPGAADKVCCHLYLIIGSFLIF